MMVLLGAAAGAAGTLYFMRSGGDLNQVKEKAKDAMGRAEREVGHLTDEMSAGKDHSIPGYSPAGT